MDSARRAVVLVLASSLLLPSCMPDLNSLSNGTVSAGGSAAGSSGAAANPGTAGSSSGGSDAAGGSSAGSGGLHVDSGAGAASGGAGAEAGSGDVGGGAGGGGTAGSGGGSGTSGGAGAGGAGAGGGAGMGGGAGIGGGAGMTGAAGMSGAGNCAAPSVGATIYNTFEHTDLLGPGFVNASAATNMDTTHGATGLSEWDAAVGASCPGALHYSFAFKAYVSASPEEVGSGFYYFSNADWSSASALHVMVKVSPVDAPITDVRLFVISGSQYLFHSMTDASKFKTGAWNEMILSLTGSDYVGTGVSQLGVQAVLDRAGTAGIPTVPPTVSIWLDDIWLQPK